MATPVWFVQQGGRLLVETDAAAGKVKRIRCNPAVQVAACTAGRLSAAIRSPAWRNFSRSPRSAALSG